MAVSLSPFAGAGWQFFDNNGVILSGGKLYVYAAGTTSSATTYTSSSGSTANTNPIILNSSGRLANEIWLTVGLNYKFILKDATDVLIGTWDNIPAGTTDVADLQAALASSTGAGMIGYIQGGTAVATTVQTKLRETVSVKDFGAVGNGVVNDYQAFYNALATNPSILVIPDGDYIVNTPLVISASIQIVGTGNPVIRSTTNGSRLFGANAINDISIDNIKFQGSSSSTTPTSAFSSVAAGNCGLVTLYNCTNIKITNCTFSTFYNGLTTIKCTDVWITNNLVTHWYLYGILGSSSSRIWVDYNDVITCDFAGAGNSYGIMITGDNAGGNASTTCSISNNYIKTVPSWDGIMTHDISNLRVVNNTIENVRIGIDVGHFDATNVIETVVIEGNIITLTSTDTWSGAGAAHNGIAVVGYDASHQCARVVVSGNQVDNCGNMSGATLSGTPGPYAFQYVRNLTVTGNQVTGAGITNTIQGMYFVGTLNCVAVTGNIFNGTFGSGVIRTQTATIDYMSVTGNTSTSANTANINEYYGTGTITQLASQNNACNCVPYAFVGTVTNSNITLYGAATAWNPGAIANGASASTVLTVTGAKIGDVGFASYSLDLLGTTISAYVSAADTVTIVITNNTGSSKTVTGGNVYFGVTKRLRQ